jgi:eukaryotic-like serine/threonine-protein kinase
VSSEIQAFGKYLLLERLNAGGMAEVFLSKSQGASGINKFVAMKRILPQYSKDANYVDMFKTEAKLVMNLNHSNVVQIFEFGVEKDQFYLIMEYVEGQNLRQALNQLKKSSKHFSIDQIVYMIKEAASGLDHAHRCIDSSTGKLLNIIHRDVSPQNIMLSFEGEVKLVDFGIAKSESQIEQTRAGTLKGKYAYMSPEQSEGLDCDARTDIFSLGIILWELLAGERLFTAENEQATLKKIRDCIIPSIRKINPAVPVELEKIVLTALAKNREQRFQTAEEFLKSLNRFLNTAYPEFSKQEFSKFMKSLNKDVYLENRKKLAEYAKIDAPMLENPVEPPKKVTKVPEKRAAPAPELPPELPSNFEPISDSEKSSLDFKTINSISVSNVRKTNLTNSQLRANASVGYNPNGNVANSRSPLLRPHENIIIPKKPKSALESFFVLLLFVSAVGGGWWYLSEASPETLTAIYGILEKTSNGIIDLASKNLDKMNKPPEPIPVPENTQVENTPKENASESTKLATLKIDSTPPGATILIDEKPVGTTPLMTTVTMSVPIKVRALKAGYLPSESLDVVPSSPADTKSFILLAEPPTGTISVQDFKGYPASTQWSVYVNGQLVSHGLPFSTKIPAGVATAVKVVDPVNKTEGEETIILGKGQLKTVIIKPTKHTTVLK